MNGLPSVEKAILVFSRFPGIGRKSAQRMIHFLLRHEGVEIQPFIDALEALRERVGFCTRCHNLAEGTRCWVCMDPDRLSSLLCVLEEPVDLMAIEKAGIFRGRYHVLGGRLNPLHGIGPDQLHLESLRIRLQEGDVEELVIATNPTVEGEATAHYVAQMAQPFVAKITRLAYGLPMGGELEYLDESTLFQAMEGRRRF
ncbi:MAG: recombination protein RecR [Magnetococcales bacterium]|nr:recombination protein RecR [Magnetococcales bacterium]MBF0151713.1 recombination protein RecR [Magnetococcales bacterium]MBF0174133.1 recombination protein RecR [Magnetococcales bacterium]MBF0346982.1 recombination protein RecR [Magnetococcales bacterium]MBF0631083.1 recombination protein RecR [Magnetococcales bacterium]